MNILQDNLGFLGSAYNINALTVILILIATWDTVWKAIALWRAARMKMLWWFIALLTMNTAGIFPIVFLLFTQNQYRKLGHAEKA